MVDTSLLKVNHYWGILLSMKATEIKETEMKTYECTRCGGEGHMREYRHIAGGECFKCGGTGTQASKPRVSKPAVINIELITENERKQAVAMELYANDDRAGVEPGHQYFFAHAIELAKLDGIWETI